MAKVYAIHEIALHPGVTPEDFERFVAQATLAQLPGVEIHFLKGDRGARAGQFAYLIAIDSVERREELFPVAGASEPTSPEVAEYLGSEATRQLMEQWSALGSTPGGEDTVYTDYVVVK